MNEVLQNCWDWFVENFLIESFAIVLGGIAALVIRALLVRLDYMRDVRGSDTHSVQGQFHIFTEQEVGDEGNKSKATVMSFRNLPGLTTLASLFQNRAAIKEVIKLSSRTSIKFPWLMFTGRRGANHLLKFFNHFCSNNYQWNWPLSTWLFVVTCEDAKFTPQECIRCFFIREEDLMKFLDEAWCRKLCVESEHHYLRIVTLRRIAQMHFEGKCVPKSGDSRTIERMGLIWQARVAIRKDDANRRAVAIDWTKGDPLASWEEAEKL